MKATPLGKFLRIATVIMIGMTAAMNVLGGVGTSCAAFFTKKYPPMWSLLDYQWLYQLFVVVTVIIGLAGGWSLIRLLRGGRNAYRNVLIVLIVGAIVNTIHVIASISLRGKATPADVVLIINVVALVVTLLIRLPGLRQQVDFEKRSDRKSQAVAGGMAALVAGITILSVGQWVAPSHTFQGQNWVDLLIWPLLLGGGSLVLIGLARLATVAASDRQAISLEQKAEG